MAESGLSRQKNLKFWIFPGIRVLIHTRRHLGGGFRKFSAKTNDKIWSYWPKTAEISYRVAKSGLLRQKNLIFWIFLGVRVLIHTRRHLGEGFRKFSGKTNDKIWSYWPETAEKSWKVSKSGLTRRKKSQILNFPRRTGINTH